MLIFAAEEGGGFNPLSVETGLYVWTTIAFLVVLFFLAKKVFPKLEESLADREAKIKGDLEEAEKTKVEAEKLLAEHKAQLAAARDEASKIADEIRQQAEAAKKQTLAATEAENRKMMERAQADLAAERERTIKGLQGEIARMAVSVASKIVEKEVSADTHRQLIDSFISDLQSEKTPAS
ncbi:MAG: F0F1 ATP synthase subunit B [Actinomycetota bacterium]